MILTYIRNLQIYDMKEKEDFQESIARHHFTSIRIIFQGENYVNR
jgi:hypothetical protein